MITDYLLKCFKKNLEWSEKVSGMSRAELRAEVKRHRALAAQWRAFGRKRHKDTAELLRLLSADRMEGN